MIATVSPVPSIRNAAGEIIGASGIARDISDQKWAQEAEQRRKTAQAKLDLISERELSLMKPTAYLINAARGPIVDEEALVRALRKGEIAGAGLDVYEKEPEMMKGLAELDNAVLLPHLGSATRGTRNLMATKAATNALAMLNGERAPNCLNPEVYDTAAYRSRTG